MKFALKFVQTSELKEFLEDFQSLFNTINDPETLKEGALIFFCVIVVYFVLILGAI